MKELGLVALERDIPEHDLKRGDIGTIVHCYGDGKTFEVEFVAVDGQTIAVLTLTNADIRPLKSNEILRVRELAMAR